MDSRWRIELLGGLRARTADRVVAHFRTQKTGLLLAYLALHSQYSQPRDALIELLWPEIDPEVGRTNLRSVLYSLRRELEPADAPPGTLLLADRLTVRLDPVAFSTDVAELREAVQAAARIAEPAQRARCLTAAAALYRGELLPGFLEPWVLAERQPVAETYLAALQQLAAAREQTGDLEGALEAARQAVTADPLREEAHYELMRLYAAAGQPSATVKQYQELERLLRQELGETPSAATRALAEELRQSARIVVVARSSAPLITPRERQSIIPAAAPQLPPQFTRFFGRTEEIARLTQILSIPETRLVTLTGPGGSGKTRLAIAVAGRLQEEFGDAVWFVPLAEVREAPRLGDALREAIGLPHAAGAKPLEQVVAALENQRCLLVLDNFEQSVEEGAPLVHSLLSRLPTLTCLVTSRERLDLTAEREFIVLPLPTPGVGISFADARIAKGDRFPTVREAKPTSRRSIAPEGSPESRKAQTEAHLNTLLQYPSVGLFVDRAQAARPGFQLTAQNAEAVVALCDRLEGLPLAIELAAARTSVLAPQQILARLSRRFELLVSDQRDRSARHRSLRAAIEGSYQQLPPELQRFFAGLSAFRGGFTLEAAEAVVCDEAGGACREPPALECLERLRKSTLVVAEEAPDAAEMRYRLLETLREYAAEQLTGEQQTALARRHAEYFFWLAEQAEAAWGSGDQDGWLERLRREQENLRAALRWSLDDGRDEEIGVRLAAAMRWFWPHQGYLREGRAWLEQALRRADITPSGVKARLLLGTGCLLLLQGDFKSAHAFCEESLPLFQEVDDRVGTAQAIYQLGWVAHCQRDLARARRLWEESLALRRQLGHKADMIQSLRNLKWLAADLRDETAARAFYEEELALMHEFGGAAAAAAQLIREVDRAGEQGNHTALRLICAEAQALWRQFGNDRDIADSLDHLGVIARDLGEYELARALLEQSLAINRALGRELNMHRGLWNAAQMARLAGDLTTARVWVDESLRIAREMGSKEPIAHALDELRLIPLKQGDWKTAVSAPRESLTLWLELGNQWGLAEALEGVAHVAVAQGEAARAARLFGAAERLRERIGRPHHPHERADYERSVAEARTALGDAAFAAAWAEGRALSPEQAVADALNA
jgi:predicted ATPase/DNA-binding SARP family transcriptional activator